MLVDILHLFFCIFFFVVVLETRSQVEWTSFIFHRFIILLSFSKLKKFITDNPGIKYQ